MRNKIYIQIVVGISLLVLTSAAPAQDEQWLQYHSERQAQRIIGDMTSSHLEVTSDKPQDVELPDFKCDDPFFACWSSPMAASGGLWMAFDRQNKQGRPYDLLYIDSNGDGNLADESAIASYEVDYRSSRRTAFGPIKLIFKGEDGPITYHINIEFLNYTGRKYLYIRAAGWYEGTVTVAGTKKHCTLIDQNANGTFNDKSLNAAECDRIRIGKKGSKDSLFVGNYIEIDDVLYRPEIARDGAYIKLSKAEDVKFGNIRIPESITDERKDEKGKKWKMQGEGFSNKGDFDITADKEAELSIGEPIISTLKATKSGSGYSFSQNLQGRLGERIELTRNEAQPPAPKLHIKNKDGTYDRTFSFEYG